jgi:hypothetical protein
MQKRKERHTPGTTPLLVRAIHSVGKHYEEVLPTTAAEIEEAEAYRK